MKVLIIGSGIMGQALTKGLARKGVLVQNIPFREAISGISQLQFTPSHILTFLRQESDSVVLWQKLIDDKVLTPGITCLESSTISPEGVRAWAAKILDADCYPIECPVTGSRAKASTCLLTLFVAAPKGEREARADPLVEAISEKVFRFEEFGQPSLYKILYNFANFRILHALTDFVSAMIRHGIDSETISSLLLDDQSWVTAVASSKIDRLFKRDFTNPDFKLETMIKDVVLRAGLEKELNPTERQFVSSLLLLNDDEITNRDFTAIFDIPL